MTDMFVVSRFVPCEPIVDGFMIVMEWTEIVWAGPAKDVPAEIMHGGDGSRRLHVNPAYLARLQTALAAKGEGTPCPHTRVWAVASIDHAHAFECRDCGARVASPMEP